MAKPIRKNAIYSVQLEVLECLHVGEQDDRGEVEVEGRELERGQTREVLVPRPRPLDRSKALPGLKSSTSRVRLYQSVLILNITHFLCGTVLTWSSPVLFKLPHVTDTQGSEMASIMCLGSVVGPFVSGVVLDLLGRKGTIALCMTLMTSSWLLLALFTDIVLLCVGRFIAGVALGINFAALPTYIAEISEDAVRAPLNTMSQIYTSSGKLLMYAVGPFVSYQVLHYIMISVCGLFFVLFPLLPNSPYYLVMKGDFDTATSTLVWLRGHKSNSSAQNELQLIKETIDRNLEKKGSLSMLFSSANNRRALTICCLLLWLQQFTGINIIFFYAQKIFEMTGSTISSNTCSIVIGVILAVSGFISPIAVKYFGYKTPLIVSLAGMAVGTGSLGVFFFLKFNNFEVDTLSWLPLLSVVIDIVFYNSGYSTIAWALSGELFPSQVKSYATTIITSSCGFLAFVTTNIFPKIVSLLGLDFLFISCAFFCLIIIIFVIVFIQDTSGLSFQDIQLVLSGTKRNDLNFNKRNRPSLELTT